MCKNLCISKASFYKWKHIIQPEQERVKIEISENG